MSFVAPPTGVEAMRKGIVGYPDAISMTWPWWTGVRDSNRVGDTDQSAIEPSE